MRLEYCLRAKPAIWGVFVGPIGLSFLPTKKLVVRIQLVSSFFIFYFLFFYFWVNRRCGRCGRCDRWVTACLD